MSKKKKRKHGGRKKRTVNDALAYCLDHTTKCGRERATLKTIDYAWHRYIGPALGERNLRKVSADDIEQFLAQLVADGLADSTIKKTIAVFRRTYVLAERRGWTKTNPARIANVPRGKIALKQWPTPEELAAFLAVAEERNADMYDLARLIAGTGVRPGEAQALRKDDLDERRLTIQRAVCVVGELRLKGTKTGCNRTFAIDDETAEIIERRPGPFVFGGENPWRTDLVSKSFRRCAKRAKVHFTPRNLRHYHATQLIAAGVDIKTVADRLGHANPNTTWKYYVGSVPQNDEHAAELVRTFVPHRTRELVAV